MSIRNLDAIFRAKSVALIGASDRPGSVGSVTAHNLLASGFEGSILPVNPRHRSVAGVFCYPDLSSLPVIPDLAVICTPPSTVPKLIGELGGRGTKGAIVITAGFRELGNEQGRALECAMLEAARPHLMRIVGPNCVGVLSTPIRLNASFAPGNAAKGGVAFVAQSGAVVTSVLDWASSRGIGFSHLVSLGDMADVDFGDMLDYLANDEATTAILLYIEAVTAARKFMSAARAASRLKPVIAIKAGRHEAAAKAASSHTGALAGMDAVYDAAFSRAGILRVQDLEEIFDAVETLAAAPAFSGDGLVILTNGGGVGVLATDALLDFGGKLTPLSPETANKLNDVLPPTWSHANPVDIIGDASGKRYADALGILLDAPETNAVLVLNCPTAIASGVEAAQAVIDTVAVKRRCVLTNWLGARSAAEARRLFSAAKIPTFDTPNDAVRGFMHLVRYRRGQNIIMEVPPSVATDFTPDYATARQIIACALSDGHEWLDEDSARRLLQCYRIPVARSKFVTDSDEAAVAASEFGGAIALKVQSPDILHKSEAGGVALNLGTPEMVREAAGAMRQRVVNSTPGARISGFLLQEMIHWPNSIELIVGVAVDPQFGPFLLFGQGGTAVEVIADRALALPPLNLPLARALIAQTRVFAQLQGYRNHPPAALDAIALTLIQLSQLACDHDELVELDINPLLADAKGVMALDARVRVLGTEGGERGARLAIKPYPRELERAEPIAGFADARLRPIRPEDAPLIANLIAKLSLEDARLRFFTPLRSLDARQIARLTQIDYDREMALVLISDGGPTADILAVVRLAADPDNRQAEFAILVRGDLQRRGIGRLLMARLIDYARARGLEEIFSDVLCENVAMLSLCRNLALKTEPIPGSADVVRAKLRFGPA